MDFAINIAKRRWLVSRSSDDKISLLQAIFRSGNQEILERLCNLWDYEAILVYYGIDSKKQESYSDHIEGVCNCIDCAFPAQFDQRIRDAKSWNMFWKILNVLIESRNVPKRDRTLLNIGLRRDAVEMLVILILEAY